jgi:hypothetical protein
VHQRVRQQCCLRQLCELRRLAVGEEELERSGPARWMGRSGQQVCIVWCSAWLTRAPPKCAAQPLTGLRSGRLRRLSPLYTPADGCGAHPSVCTDVLGIALGDEAPAATHEYVLRAGVTAAASFRHEKVGVFHARQSSVRDERENDARTRQERAKNPCWLCSPPWCCRPRLV